MKSTRDKTQKYETKCWSPSPTKKMKSTVPAALPWAKSKFVLDTETRFVLDDETTMEKTKSTALILYFGRRNPCLF